MTDIDDDVDSSPGLSLKAFADLAIKVGQVGDELRKANQREQYRLAHNPKYIPLERMSLVQAGTTDVVDFGGPEDGLIWTVRALLVGQSPDPTVTNTANVAWCVGQRGSLTATSTREIMVGLPKSLNYGSGRIVLRSNQNLIANLSAIPVAPNNAIALVAIVEEEPLWDARQTVGTI